MEVRIVVVLPGYSRAYDAAEWRDALVVVERGRIDLCGPGGGRLGFGAGEGLWLAALALSRVYHPGPEAAVPAAVARARGRRASWPGCARVSRAAVAWSWA